MTVIIPDNTIPNPTTYTFTVTCNGCGGKGYIIVNDTPKKAHSEICPVCKGSGYISSPYYFPYTYPFVTTTTTYTNEVTQ